MFGSSPDFSRTPKDQSHRCDHRNTLPSYREVRQMLVASKCLFSSSVSSLDKRKLPPVLRAKIVATLAVADKTSEHGSEPELCHFFARLKVPLTSRLILPRPTRCESAAADEFGAKPRSMKTLRA